MRWTLGWRRSSLFFGKDFLCANYGTNSGGWQTVVGLEIHAQLASGKKLFSGARNEADATANSHYTVFDAGMPGSLPVLNRECVTLAMRAALALGCAIPETPLHFERKHYRYADLPLGYQITQHSRPVAVGGQIGGVRIKQVQIEQDSARTVGGLIDLNRCGVGLVEIVTEPDMRSAAEAVVLAKAVRERLVDAGVCGGALALGQMRFDANVSVTGPRAPKDAPALGQRVEIKNVNTFSGLRRAIEAEAQRQMALMEAGGRVARETRSYCEATRTTIASREKEEAADYMFIPDFDIPPVHIDADWIAEVRRTMPELSAQRHARYSKAYGLSEREVAVLDSRDGLATLFEEIVGTLAVDPRLAFSFLTNKYLGLLTRHGLAFDDHPLEANLVGAVLQKLQIGDIDHHMAQTVLSAYLQGETRSLNEALDGQEQRSELTAELRSKLDGLIAANPKRVELIRTREGAVDFFVGSLLKDSAKGSIAPAKLRPLILEYIQRHLCSQQQ